MSHVQSINIVEDAEGELRVSSIIIAGRTGNQHASVLRVIRDNIEDFETFGGVGFEIAPFETAGGTQTREVAHLNEQQSTLLMTFMRNNEMVKAFKIELVKQFYTMRQALSSQFQLPKTFSEALRELATSVEKNTELEQKIVADAPKVDYVDRFVGKSSDVITVDVFASQFGSTGPMVRDLLLEKKIAVRRHMGERWSGSKQRMEDVYEWRPRQGLESADWFEVLPQNNAPRLHNGQLGQTMYVRQFYALDLARKLGLVEAVA